MACDLHEARQLCRDLATHYGAWTLPASVHHIQSVEATLEASFLLSKVWSGGFHSCRKPAHRSDVSESHHVLRLGESAGGAVEKLLSRFEGALQFNLFGWICNRAHRIKRGAHTLAQLRQFGDVNFAVQDRDARANAIAQLRRCTCPTCERQMQRQ